MVARTLDPPVSCVAAVKRALKESRSQRVLALEVVAPPAALVVLAENCKTTTEAAAAVRRLPERAITLQPKQFPKPCQKTTRPLDLAVKALAHPGELEAGSQVSGLSSSYPVAAFGWLGFPSIIFSLGFSERRILRFVRPRWVLRGKKKPDA